MFRFLYLFITNFYNLIIGQISSTVQLLVADIMPKTTERFENFSVCCVFFIAIVLITFIHSLAFAFKSLRVQSFFYYMYVIMSSVATAVEGNLQHQPQHKLRSPHGDRH